MNLFSRACTRLEIRGVKLYSALCPEIKQSVHTTSRSFRAPPSTEQRNGTENVRTVRGELELEARLLRPQLNLQLLSVWGRAVEKFTEKVDVCVVDRKTRRLVLRHSLIVFLREQVEVV
jgi:hypothetical protein